MVWVELIVINIKMNNIKDPLQILQIWFSSSFPVGSYAYSHGLEAIIDNKLINNKNDVEEFLNALLFNGTLRNEYIFIKSISKERQIEMVDMGNSFRKIMKQSWDFELAENTAFTYCLTKAAIHFNIKFDYLIKFYLQSFISNLINVCVKHIPISQKDGQKLNVIFINQIQDFLQKSEKLNLEDIGSTFFIGDLFSIKHENLETRIYLT